MESFQLKAADGKLIRGDRARGKDRQLLFITGFLSKRWGYKSKALAQWCRERGWGFCCFDFRGWGDSEGSWGDYRLLQWLEDAQAVTKMLNDGTDLTHPPQARRDAPSPRVTIVGNSLGGWLAWLVAQEQQAVEELILIAPAFNMMRVRAAEIPAERRARWQAAGSIPWDDEPLHREAPIPWNWVEDSEVLWQRRLSRPRLIRSPIEQSGTFGNLSPTRYEGITMLVLIHKECGGPALEESPVGEVCAIPVNQFPFSCFTCLEEILDESEVRLSEELGI